MARILIVEDDPVLADALARGLREERHVVELARDGLAGWEAVQQATHDLILLDRMLPRLDGLELCQRLRRAGCAAPILMLTARDATRDVVAGLDAGANDYLTKPFVFDELLARIRALLRGPGAATAELVVGPLRLDTISHRVFCGAAELPLTAKEYQLLAALMHRPGRILSKAQLAELAWEWDREPQSNAIEVHLSALRHKLEQVAAGGLLRTIRGRGYLLEEPAS